MSEPTDTTQQTTWPPPPTTPDPLAAHDALLTAVVCAPVTKRTLTRLRLVVALQKETGMDLRRCLAIVSGYCERKDIFPQPRGLQSWLPLLPGLALLALVANLFIRQSQLGRELAAAHTRHARHLILGEHIQWDGFFLCLTAVVPAVLFVNVLVAHRRTRREDEEARRNMGSGLEGA